MGIDAVVYVPGSGLDVLRVSVLGSKRFVERKIGYLADNARACT